MRRDAASRGNATVRGARVRAGTSERETGHGTWTFRPHVRGSFPRCEMSGNATMATTSTRMYPMRPVVVLPAKFPSSGPMYKMRNIHRDASDTRPRRDDAASTATEAKMPDDAVVTQVIRLLQVSVSFPLGRAPRPPYRPCPRRPLARSPRSAVATVVAVARASET